jgi:hypothetical protein
MSTIADYQGRKFDILAFQPKSFSTELSQAVAGDSSGGLICVGVQKLAQRWVLEFLTPVGSIPYKTDRGSSFMPRLAAGEIRTDVDVSTFFYLAAAQVKPNLINEDALTDPDDEKFASVSLDNFSFAPGGKLVLQVSVYSVAGASRQVILPISVTAGLI